MPQHQATFLAIALGARLVCLPATHAESNGPIQFQHGDTGVLLGGANIVGMQDYGYLETLLHLEHPELHLRFRNMGWEGDTVYEQYRMLNFGSWPDQLQRVEADVLFAHFGNVEALEPGFERQRFLQSYEEWMTRLEPYVRTIVLVSPAPFEARSFPLRDLSLLNPKLKEIAAGLKELAQAKGWKFIDLFHPLEDDFSQPTPQTKAGLHWNVKGHWIVAQQWAAAMGVKNRGISRSSATGALKPALAEEIRRQILVKDRFWFNFWRPMNWAFLHGDRTEQPSSRDHKDPAVRWFPREMTEFLPLIQERENQIHKLAARFSSAR